jgi:hypothetical protein
MARLTIHTDNYSRWRWTISQRGGELADATSVESFDSREDAHEAAVESLGSEADGADVFVDGVTPRTYSPPPLPSVDAKAEAMAAGFSTGPDAPPDVMTGA